MTLYFATVFDRNYLSRGVTLYNSLKQHHSSFQLYILCLDEEVFQFFLKRNYGNVFLIKLAEVEACYPELITVKDTRSRIDYLFTLSPYYPSYILKINPDLPFICSLDCDQFFFGNVEDVFNSLRDYSVLIMGHRFPKHLLHLEIWGKYNVSFQVFKNDPIGNRCLQVWRNQCLEWCSDVLDGDRFADQKYLDKWQELIGPGVCEIGNIGVGLAPWNLSQHEISFKEGKVFVDDQPLLLFHYQGLRIINKNLIDTRFRNYGVLLNKSLVNYILYPIINSLFKHEPYFSDTIQRNHSVHKQTSFLKSISSEDMLVRINGFLFNLHLFPKLQSLKSKVNGILNRFKNLHR